MTPDDGSSILRQSLRGGAVTTIFKAEKGKIVLEALEVAPHDLLTIFRRAWSVKSPWPSESSIWEVHTDQSGNEEFAQQLNDWRSEQVEQLSASADGRRLAFLSTSRQSDVYVADFDPHVGFTPIDSDKAIVDPKRRRLAHSGDVVFIE